MPKSCKTVSGYPFHNNHLFNASDVGQAAFLLPCTLIMRGWMYTPPGIVDECCQSCDMACLLHLTVAETENLLQIKQAAVSPRHTETGVRQTDTVVCVCVGVCVCVCVCVCVYILGKSPSFTLSPV